MTHPLAEEDHMPDEIDFSHARRGIHHIPPGEKVWLPVSIERSVWEYLSAKAERKGVDLSELVTDILRRDIEIREVLK